MQGRSWMAALVLMGALITALILGVTAEADTQPETPPAPAPPQSVPPVPPGKAEGPKHTVLLMLAIADLPAKGCDVEIKPSHPGCSFRKRAEHVTADGQLKVVLDDIRVKNANRDCTFAITIREPGQAERTWRRGLRISTNNNSENAQTLPCYFSSPSKLAKTELEAAEKTKRR
jgi:hypothetical protein